MSTTVPPLNLDNVQGDILSGLLKKTETEIFFQIDNVDTFRSQLTNLVPLITTTTRVNQDRKAVADHKAASAAQGRPKTLLEIAAVQIAFSQSGLTKLGIQDNIGDSLFSAGQRADAQTLGDHGTTTNGTFDPDWNPAFKNGVDGIIIVAGDSPATVTNSVSQVEGIFGVGKPDASIHEVLRLIGSVRPDDQKGHEHFGFLDGISDPAVDGVTLTPLPGQESVSQGFILLGRENDPNQAARPAWALDGSFLAFRLLQQLVPEFNTFLKENPIGVEQGIPPEQGSELLGARMVGRWKSGAPVDLAPLQDDPELGADPQRNNDFQYTFPEDIDTQTRCPFAAHLRKTNPRNDLEGSGFDIKKNRIIRRGIPFGPELTPEEISENKTLQSRGLLFRCYQSVLANGFHFVQVSWANNRGFPFTKPDKQPGIDPIIGQDPARSMDGLDPQNQSQLLPLPEWVVSQGGEYFFSPSIPTLRDVFAHA